MSTVGVLYAEFRAGLDTQPGPQDENFTTFWELYTEVVNLAGCRLMERKFGSSLAGAEEVRLHVARFHRVAAITEGMPLTVPPPAVRSMRAMGRLIQDTPHVEDVWAFLRLSAPVVNDLAAFTERFLGRASRPVTDALTLLARSGTLMLDGLVRSVPALVEEGMN